MADFHPELWDFPCPFPLKIMGLAEEALLHEVLSVVQRHAPGDYQPRVKPSRQGNYHAISVTIVATGREQLDNLYRELTALERVKIVL